MNLDKNKKIFNNLIKQNSKTYSNKNQIKESMREDLQNYQSTARTFLRGAWFFDYIGYLIKRFVDDREIPLGDLAKESYSATLAPKHPWIIRTPARWAMGLIASREEFIDSLCKEQTVV